MGTTAQKGAYLNQTKLLLKDKINALGGSIDDETTFREYANQLDGIYDAIPKTEYQSGSEVNLGKTIKGKLDFAKEYQEVEYIESTGTQYIDTGKKATSNNIKIKTKVFTPSFPTNNEEDIIANFGTDNSRFVVGLFSGNVFQYNNGNPNASVAGFSGEQTLEIEANYDFTSSNKTIKVGNSTVNGAYTIGGSNNADNIIIFANAQHSRNFTGKLYYIQYYENNTLVFDFIPCYRISDNVIGLYDKVEGKFYTNAGTGTFTKGADVGNGFVDIVGIGQSSQDSTQGYNELNIYAVHSAGYTETVSGVTFKYNDDGSVTANGTATADINYFLGSRATLGDIFNGTYYLSGCKTGSNTTYYLSMWTEGIGAYPQTTTEVATNKTSGVNWNIVIAVKNGASVNYTFYPMMSKTSGKSFEPYTNGASPNPSYPQEIKYVRGRNKLDVSKNTNGYVLSTTGELNQAEGYCVSDFIPVQQGATYNVSYKLLSSVQDANTTRVGFYDSSKTFISRPFSTDNPYIITIPSNCHYVRLSYQYPARSEMQFEEGSIAHPYLPYNTIEEVVSGKNLNEYNINSAANKFQSIINLKNSITFKANNTYTLAFDTPNTGIVVYHQELDGITWDKYSVTLNGTRRFFTFTIGDNDITTVSNWGIILRITDTSEISTGLVTNVMLYEGEYDSSIPYEPYITPTSYQLSLGDIELNAIGNYKDELIYDVDEDKVYKNEAIGKVVLTGSEDWQGGEVETGIYRYQITLADAINIASRQNALTEYTHFSLTGEVGTGFIYSKIFYFYPDRDKTNAILFKAWLTEHNTPLLYPLATPVEIPITNTTLINQVKTLYNAHSNNGTTIITSNGNLPMIIKCRANTEGITPTGTKSITQNGTYDVKEYASANVNVSGIIPTGTLSITENGTYNVTNYASASVNVESSSYPPDWSLIGYSDTPPAITNGFNYAKAIYDNWDNTTTMFDFKAYTKLVIFPLIDTSNVNYMYQGLKDVVGLISMPLINTEKVTDMGMLFSGCRALVDVPVLATSRLSSWGLNSTFSSCFSLSDESLNNIMRMCINATGVTGGYKSLRMLGLTNAQWTRCQSLSNYQEFLDAGWTTD